MNQAEEDAKTSADGDAVERIRACDSLLLLVFDSYHLHRSHDRAPNPFSA